MIERRFKHRRAGITVTNKTLNGVLLENEYIHRKDDSFRFYPKEIIENTSDWEEIFPYAIMFNGVVYRLRDKIYFSGKGDIKHIGVLNSASKSYWNESEITQDRLTQDKSSKFWEEYDAIMCKLKELVKNAN